MRDEGNRYCTSPPQRHLLQILRRHIRADSLCAIKSKFSGVLQVLQHSRFILLAGGLRGSGNILVTTFGIRPIAATPEEDMKAILGRELLFPRSSRAWEG
jgi:hypothetical protein